MISFDLVYPILIHFGNFEYYASKDKCDHVILKVNDALTLSCSEDPIGGPMQLSAIFRDKSNNVCLKIDKNEWKASTENWDIKQTGKKLNIYNPDKKIGIKIEARPPHEIYFNRLTTYFDNNKLLLDKKKMIIKKADGKEFRIGTSGIIRRLAPIIIDLRRKPGYCHNKIA